MWEFAPGSPWKTIFGRVAGAIMRLPTRCKRVKSTFAVRSTFRKHGAGGFEVVRGVDAERHRSHDGDVDPHAGLERAELLELLAPLQHRWRQPDEPFERRPAIGVKPDVVIEQPVPVRRGGAGEIE